MEIKRSVGLLPPRDQGGSPTPTYQRNTNNTPRPTNRAPNNVPTPPPSAPSVSFANPYRSQPQQTYIPYNNNPSGSNGPPSARRVTQNVHEAQDNEQHNNDYYEETVNDFEQTNNDSIIEVEDNNNGDLNVYSTPTPKCRTVTFASNTKAPLSDNIISTTTHAPSTQSLAPELKSLYRFVFDSGATDHMTPFPELFESINYYDQSLPSSPVVIMGDETTQVPILGHGFINITIHGKRLRVHSLYIPGMGSTSLFSIRQHMRYLGCIFHAESNNSSVSFPDFIIYPRVDQEIDVLCHNSTSSSAPINFDESHSLPIPNKASDSSAVCKRTDKRYTTVKLVS